MECWGASGGGSRSDGTATNMQGYGGYTVGTLALTAIRVFYVYVGGKGADCPYNSSTKRTTGNAAGGWNGGGDGAYDQSDDDGDGGGGGATDIRLSTNNTTATTWNDFSSLKSRIMVAGGGGGSTFYMSPSNITKGGCGGNQTGGYGTINSSNYPKTSPGTQISGYAFGAGQSGKHVKSNWEMAGCGGGYYGGTTDVANEGSYNYVAGPGGSSYISGYSGCNAIKEEATTGGEENHTGSPNHYSGYIFTAANMINGSTSGMPKPTAATGTMTGNNDNGYARITCKPYE